MKAMTDRNPDENAAQNPDAPQPAEPGGHPTGGLTFGGAVNQDPAAADGTAPGEPAPDAPAPAAPPAPPAPPAQDAPGAAGPPPAAPVAPGAPDAQTVAYPAAADAPAAYPPYADQTAQYPTAQYPGGPGQQAPFTAGQPGGPGTPPPSKGLSKGALIGIIAGAAALLVLIIVGVSLALSIGRGGGDEAGGGGGEEGGGAATAASPSEAVEMYLTALSEGDAEGALVFVDSYGDDSLLTDEVLADSLTRAPITDIVVDEDATEGEYETTVAATFQVGDVAVDRTFDVTNLSDEWVIYDGLISVSVGSSFEGLDLLINGAEAPESGYAFPGSYEFVVGREEFTIGGDIDSNVFTIATDDDREQLYDIRPELSEEGTETFRSLVSASLDECLAMKSLSTPCGMDVEGADLQGYSPVDGSVNRKLTAEGQTALKKLEAVPGSSPALVTTYDSIRVDITLQGEKDGTRADFEMLFGAGLGTPYVDFDEEELSVLWD